MNWKVSCYRLHSVEFILNADRSTQEYYYQLCVTGILVDSVYSRVTVYELLIHSTINVSFLSYNVFPSDCCCSPDCTEKF